VKNKEAGPKSCSKIPYKVKPTLSPDVTVMDISVAVERTLPAKCWPVGPYTVTTSPAKVKFHSPLIYPSLIWSPRQVPLTGVTGLGPVVEVVDPPVPVPVPPVPVVPEVGSVVLPPEVVRNIQVVV